MWFTVNLEQSQSPVDFFLTGIDREILAGETTTYTTPVGLQNNHLSIVVNSIDGAGGVVTVSGTSIDEKTSIPNPTATEDITMDGTTGQTYQTSLKWLSISEVGVTGPSGPSSINYDLRVLGYTDIGNRDFNIDGYRAEITAAGSKANVNLKIVKIQNDGSGKFSMVNIEDISIEDNGSAPGFITDNIRSGAYDRSYTGPAGDTGFSLWPNGSEFVLKQGDFNEYFPLVGATSTNIINNTTIGDEGILIKLESDSIGGPGGPGYIRLQVRYYFI